MKIQELLDNPNDLCEEVMRVCRPLSYFDDYLREGYYPFILEGQAEYSIRLENVINYVIEVELPKLCNVDVANIRKLKAMVAVLSSNVPQQIDMQKLSTMLEVSRVTLLGYFQHLAKAKILNLLYSSEINIKKLQKPDKIFVENPNQNQRNKRQNNLRNKTLARNRQAAIRSKSQNNKSANRIRERSRMG